MPKLYGTGLYGKGNYSALTAYTTTAAQGSYTLSGQNVSMPLAGKLTAVFGSYVLTGIAAGINSLKWAVDTGYYTLTGKAAQFTQSKLWTGQTDV